MRRTAISCLFFLVIAIIIFSFMENKEPLTVKADIIVNAPSIKESKEVGNHLDSSRNLPKAPESANERDRKVQERLDNFIKKTSHITAESVARERKQIGQGLKKALSQKTEMPRIRREVDEQGEAWEEMRFSNGIIRYLPVPKEDNKI